MEIKSFPNNKDEYIGAEDVMRWHHGRTSGVFGEDGGAAVLAVQGEMAVTVDDGTGWITDETNNGIVWWNDSQRVGGEKLKLQIDNADGVLDRIDRVVVTWQTTNYVDRPVIEILKGTKSGNPVAPALTNNNVRRQISLARIRVVAGSLAVSPSQITDERFDASVCGIVTERVGIDTQTINQNVNATLDETKRASNATLRAIEGELAGIQAGTGLEMAKKLFLNVVVPVSAFVSDKTYDDYTIRAAVPLEGVLGSMIPEVYFGMADASGGNYAPVAECYPGGVYIYAASAPDKPVTIPTIICWKGGV